VGEEHRRTQSQGINNIKPSLPSPNRITQLHNSAKKIGGIRECQKNGSVPVHPSPPIYFDYLFFIFLVLGIRGCKAKKGGKKQEG
jgi:hypothetical protein